MKKLKLHVDDLKIDSFLVSKAFNKNQRIGTIIAHATDICTVDCSDRCITESPGCPDLTEYPYCPGMTDFPFCT